MAPGSHFLRANLIPGVNFSPTPSPRSLVPRPGPRWPGGSTGIGLRCIFALLFSLTLRRSSKERPPDDFFSGITDLVFYNTAILDPRRATCPPPSPLYQNIEQVFAEGASGHRV
ncbi:hypothetical protein DPEC_G00076680 [Dallia pectoralis]|uniref:Uncharacterized protein n=1 Tax=Dallia pectoralis TaxID=75939 RepID=A0ACC2H408_DALPE|nr:hypothetical protein DPEC_G00076680 [Dallia pectoralis]